MGGDIFVLPLSLQVVMEPNWAGHTLIHVLFCYVTPLLLPERQHAI